MPTDVKTPKKVFDKENSGSNKDIASPSKKKATASVSPIGSPQKDAEAAVPASPRTSTQAHQSTPNTPARPASKSDATPKRSESPVPGTPPPRPPSSSSSNIEYKTQNLGPGSANVKVSIRVRPLIRREIELNDNISLQISDTEINIFGQDSSKRENTKKFTFDSILGIKSTQDEVYEKCASNLVNQYLEGFNGCLFCYGQTGSGKTFTMYGNAENPGIVYHCVNRISQYTKENANDFDFSMSIQYLEIYQEVLIDLLVPRKNRASTESSSVLKIREDPKRGVYVQGTTIRNVQTTEDVAEIVAEGNSRRTVGKTNMNDESSRSHSVLSITLTQNMKNDAEGFHSRESVLHLIDLAGSERAEQTGATGERLKEGANINQSLSTLGQVIKSLVTGAAHVPYRDSKLTRLLQNSLGGNSMTSMICNVSPAGSNFNESLSALRFADRAKHIVNKPTKYQDPKLQRIAELEAEVERLRGLLAKCTCGAGGAAAAKPTKGLASTTMQTDGTGASPEKKKEEKKSQKAEDHKGGSCCMVM